MRTLSGVFLSVMLLSAPAAAQVTEPTDKQAADVAPPAPAPAAETAAKPVAVPPTEGVENAGAQETLFGEGDIDHGGYGGPQLKIGRVAAGDAVFFGGKGGWIIDHNLVIGGGGWGMTNRRDAPERLQPRAPSDTRRVINLGYGGGLIEYFIRPEKVVHGTVGLLIGGGGLNLRNRDADCRGDRECMDENDEGLHDSFFILEPEAGLEVNVVKFMRVNAGVTYRYVTGIGGIGFDNDDLRGFSGTLTLRFGQF